VEFEMTKLRNDAKGSAFLIRPIHHLHHTMTYIAHRVS